MAPADELTSPEGSSSSFVQLTYALNTRFFVGFLRGPCSHPSHLLGLPPREARFAALGHGFHQWAPANRSSSQHRRKNSALRLVSTVGLQQDSASLWGCPLHKAPSGLPPSASAWRIPAFIDRPLACQPVVTKSPVETGASRGFASDLSRVAPFEDLGSATFRTLRPTVRSNRHKLLSSFDLMALFVLSVRTSSQAPTPSGLPRQAPSPDLRSVPATRMVQQTARRLRFRLPSSISDVRGLGSE
jgi:hypothetical protein